MMIPILFIALPVHEFAHGWVAYRMGDPTAKYAGRLTLNPFKHLDLMGVLMMFLVGVGWARPVPVNSTYLKNRRTGLLLISLAGPLSNLVLAFLGMFIWGLIVKLVNVGIIVINSMTMADVLIYGTEFLQAFIFVNISLAVFNLIPVPPLDGSRILSSVIPEESYYRFARYEQFIGLAFLLLVVVLPDNLFSRFINFFAMPIYDSMVLTVRLIFGM
ncbi:MAG: site-2 protease family protein [Clostridiaceae bacterium]|nr:site-2 protease family protein [Clostridiaceae bacterium]